MRFNFSKVVVSLSGSFFDEPELICEYAKIFSKIRSKLEMLCVVTGGGRVAREYIAKAEIVGLKERERHMLGIAVTRVNALLLGFALSFEEIPQSYREAVKQLRKNGFAICGGMKPGQSTDKVAADIACMIDADAVINLTKVDGVYDKDPEKYQDARLLKELSYEQLEKILSSQKSSPGKFELFDLLAVKELAKREIPIFFACGKEVKNLVEILRGNNPGTKVCKKPVNWEEVIEKMEKEAKKRNAPVYELSFKDPFQILLAAVISTRTKDEITLSVCKKLFSKVKTPSQLAKMRENELAELLKPAGFYREKAKKLKELARIIAEKYGSRIPETKEELLSLPGVGKKVANVVLANIGKDAIAVDTHVHRIANRLGVLHSKTPKETEKKLKRIVPRNLWKKLNKTFVGFGQTVCTPKKPRCGECPLSKICDFAKV